MDIHDVLAKASIGAACTAALTLCGAVINGTLNASREDSVQNIKLEAIQKRQTETDKTLQRLDESVRSLDRNVAVLNERLRNAT